MARSAGLPPGAEQVPAWVALFNIGLVLATLILAVALVFWALHPTWAGAIPGVLWTAFYVVIVVTVLAGRAPDLIACVFTGISSGSRRTIMRLSYLASLPIATDGTR